MPEINYLQAYPENIRQQVQVLFDEKKLEDYINKKYPTHHGVVNDKLLREYVLEIKNQYIKKSSPLSKIIFDPKIHVINHALGLHSFVNRKQGNKIKSKNEIRISHIFKKCPEPFLNMIVVHELAHLKEKEHNKAFYQLCQNMLPDYFQLEFDMRCFLNLVKL
ncbi:M48 family metallopeptidase [Marinicellulosiphila megalodicopiae]|uniref:M48 metallopeptidase family protein n=1 Tax=Marinicellulosiphila megalodicopiae TaxID=2724896 RepID=UPI003BB08E05